MNLLFDRLPSFENRPFLGRGFALRLITCFGAIYLFGFSDSVAHSAPRETKGTSFVIVGDPYEIMTRAKPCVIEDQLKVAARIAANESFEARPTYMSLVDKFHVVKGQTVKKGQLIATSVTTSLEKMRSIYSDYVALYRAQVRIAENSRKVAETRRNRIQDLAKKGVMSTAELEQSENTVVSAKQSEERMLRGLQSMLENVKTYDDQIKQSNFYSAMDGVVTELIVDPKSLSGNLMVMPGTMIAKIEKPGRYRAEAQLFDNQIHGVRSGMAASVVLPDGSKIDGKVTYVSTLPVEAKTEQSSYMSYGSAEPQNKGGLTFYKAIVEFDRPGPILPPSLLSEVNIVKSSYKAKACLPWNAIQIADGKPSVRIFEDGKGWSQSPVVLGKQGRYQVELQSPLAAEALVKSRLW